MKSLTVAMLALAIGLSLGAPASAGVIGKVAQETTEFLVKKFGREVAEEGAEKLAGKLTAAAARHGDDVFAAVRKVGPKALGLVDDAGENAPRVIRFLSRHGDDGMRVLSHPQGMALFARFGDDAAEVLVKHQGVAAPLLENLGQPAVKALGAVGPRAGRRMAILGSELAGSGQSPELMGVIARFGDPAMEFIWKHKAILAGGAALTAFIANPEPYISGAADISRIAVDGATEVTIAVAEQVAKPAVVAAGNVAVETVNAVRPVLIAGAVALAVLLGLAIKGSPLTRWPLQLALKLAGKQAVACVAGKK